MSEPQMTAYRLTDRIAEAHQHLTQEVEAALRPWVQSVEERLAHLEEQSFREGQVPPQELTMAHLQEAMAAANRRLVRLESAEVPPHRHKPFIAGPIPPLPYPIPEEQAQKGTPETPSSEAIETAAETKPIWSTSRTWLFHANQDGTRTPSVEEAISDWLNFQQSRGDWQVEVTLSMRTSKGSTPLHGSASPSTVEPAPAASGHAGEPKTILLETDSPLMRVWDNPEDAIYDTSTQPADPSTGRSANIVDLAWGLIANAYNGEWANAPADWREAAIRWRDMYPRPDSTTSQVKGEGPLPLRLICPFCGSRHIDEGEWATRWHHDHLCQKCGHEWRPAIEYTVGVPDPEKGEEDGKQREVVAGGRRAQYR